MSHNPTVIFANETGNGDHLFGFNGGLGCIVVWGNFNTCRVALFITPDAGVTKIPIQQGNPLKDVDFTSDGVVQINAAPGFDYVLEISSVGGATDVSASIGHGPPL